MDGIDLINLMYREVDPADYPILEILDDKNATMSDFSDSGEVEELTFDDKYFTDGYDDIAYVYVDNTITLKVEEDFETFVMVFTKQ